LNHLSLIEKMSQADYSINDPAFLMGVVQKVTKAIGRSLTDTEETNVLDYVIKNIPNQYFNDRTKREIGNKVSQAAIKTLRLGVEHSFVDTHEMLKRSLNNMPLEEQNAIKKDEADSVEVIVDNILGVRDIPTLVKQLNQPKSSVNTAYLLLDTRYRSLENDGTAYFTWGHINSIARGQGTVNSIGNIRDIISIKLMRFRLPNTPSTNTAYKRVSVLISELSPQSTIAHEDTRYHFMGKVDVESASVIEVDPDKFSKAEYNFNKPITSLNTLTLSLRSPLEPIVLDPDRLTATVTAYASPTTIVFDTNHNLVTGDVIYIENFTTVNPDYDQGIIVAMNRKTGNAATVIDPTTITITVDSTDTIVAIAGTTTAPSTTLAGTVSTTRGSPIITGSGTSFSIDFAVGDYIDVAGNIYQVKTINTATALTITVPYAQVAGSGLSYRLTGTTITGTGADFETKLNVGDNIIIADGGDNPEFIVKSIKSNNELTITTPYNGLDGAGFTMTKDNSVDDSLRVFLGSKRIFFNLEVTYLSS
jgi:hypothetical protein